MASGTSKVIAVGDTFTSFEDVEKAIKNLEAEQKVTYWKRDSRTLAAAQRFCINLPQNERIKYYTIKYTCIKGGKPHQSTSKGKRPNQR